MGYYIGPFFIPYYGFFIVLGIFAASVAGVIQVKRSKQDINDFILLAATVGLGGLVGAKILYLIVSWRSIRFAELADFSYFNSLMGGGFVFYGGLIGGALSLFFCKKCFHIDVSLYTSICIPCIPIAHGFGRLGCNAVGCCYGISFDSPFSVLYHDSFFAPNDIPLFPVQLTEAFGNFIIAILLFVYIDVLRKKHGFFLYLFLYAGMRFLLEYFRYDERRGAFGVFSVSQWISILLCVFALFWLARSKRKALKQ